MRRNPLMLILGLAILGLAIVVGLNYQKWFGPAAEAPVAEAPATPAEPAATTTAETTTAAATPAEPAPAAEPAKPSFDVVRVEKDGTAVIAGRGEPGASVKVTASGTLLGEAIATENGEWVLVPKDPLKPGSYELKVSETVNGQEITSDVTVALSVPAAGSTDEVVAVVTAPDAASAVLSPTPSQQVAVELALVTIDYNKEGKMIFSGSGPADQYLQVYADNKNIGTLIIGKDGKWSFTSENAVEPGDHTLRLDALDGDANVIARVEVPFTRAAAEAVAAEAPKDGKIIIQPGNNLWRIARVIYGDGLRYTDIFQANKDTIRDPNVIYPGQVLLTPGVVPPETIDPNSREPLNGDAQ